MKKFYMLLVAFATVASFSMIACKGGEGEGEDSTKVDSPKVEVVDTPVVDTAAADSTADSAK